MMCSRLGWKPSPPHPLRGGPSPWSATVLVAALLAVLLVALPSAAQDEGQTGSEGLPFIDRVEVDVVNVEVFATDGQGRRVTDLERDDFEIRVDGEPVSVTNFYLSREARRADEPDEVTEAGAVADAVPGVAVEDRATEDGMESPVADVPVQVPQPQVDRRPLFLVVYVDNVNLTPSNRKKVLDDLRVLATERAAAGDQVMMVGYDGGLQVVQPMTGDPELLEQAIGRIEKQTTRRQLADIALRQSIQRIRQGLAAQVPGTIQSELARYRQERLNEALGAYSSLHALVRGMAGLPGRKAVLYVSEGIPSSPGAELASLVSGGGPTLGGNTSDLSRYYGRIAEEANAHEITLYTLDARGSQSGFFTGADSRSVSDFGTIADLEFSRNINLQEPLLDMALFTGGQAILNTGDFAGAMDDMVEDFRSFYSLGFASPSRGDGEYHEIEVRVKRPGVRLRHRAGYLDKSQADRVADRTTTFLLQQWESNPMGVKLGFGEPKKKRLKWIVPVLVRFPADAVALLPRGDQSVGRVHLYVAVRDEEGGQSEVTRLPRDVVVPTKQLEQARRNGEVPGDVGYSVEISLRPGPSNLVVGVWDEIGGTESYVFQKLVVGGPN